mmetsp:Transcript_122606/g.342059  ORF Transcript_122606/g.342059 Transcript_122606/m.342059 type:complete len:121 (-) Transcript_122606:82-444(-)
MYATAGGVPGAAAAALTGTLCFNGRGDGVRLRNSPGWVAWLPVVPGLVTSLIAVPGRVSGPPSVPGRESCVSGREAPGRESSENVEERLAAVPARPPPVAVAPAAASPLGAAHCHVVASR